MFLKNKDIIVFGGSAGSVVLLYKLLESLPHSFKIPIIIVVHRPEEKKSKMRSVFQSHCKVQIFEPEGKTNIHSNKIYLAPPGVHLVFTAKNTIDIDKGKLVQYSRPSIDVLFMSAARYHQANLIGILVTGSNEDGARGMQVIGENGGYTIVQDPNEARLNRMPKAAIKLRNPDKIYAQDEIINFLKRLHILNR